MKKFGLLELEGRPPNESLGTSVENLGAAVVLKAPKLSDGVDSIGFCVAANREKDDSGVGAGCCVSLPKVNDPLVGLGSPNMNGVLTVGTIAGVLPNELGVFSVTVVLTGLASEFSLVRKEGVDVSAVTIVLVLFSVAGLAPNMNVVSVLGAVDNESKLNGVDAFFSSTFSVSFTSGVLNRDEPNTTGVVVATLVVGVLTPKLVPNEIGPVDVVAAPNLIDEEAGGAWKMSDLGRLSEIGRLTDFGIEPGLLDWQQTHLSVSESFLTMHESQVHLFVVKESVAGLLENIFVGICVVSSVVGLEVMQQAHLSLISALETKQVWQVHLEALGALVSLLKRLVGSGAGSVGGVS